MNEKRYIIDLRQFTDGPNPYGTSRGREAHAKLVDHIDKLQGASIVGISLANMAGADMSFFRECLIYTAKRYSNQIHFYVCDIDEDLFSNLQGAANLGGQRLTCWVGNECRFVGPETSVSNKALLELVVNNREATTADAAAALDISVQNASTRLKRLSEEGFLLRTEATAESGGKEFVYQVVGKSA
ncbi:winged helix-turn-helix transcriptional regulator [Pseudomonas nitroreducens]|uniref:winged helix-turn-helix transcriptional regulator n=1 Tax=Pseudomonas nitroreducens TaxID=46680 RepID=UPI00382A6E40